jgi:flagellar hook-length control protein FliK
MMPAISLTPLPLLPPLQFTPEPELNFKAVLEAVPAPATPATTPALPSAPVPALASAPVLASAPEPEPEQLVASESSQTLLTFLGINPVKAQMISPESPAMDEELRDDEVPVSTELFSREGGSPVASPTLSSIPPARPPALENGASLESAPVVTLPKRAVSELLPKPSRPFDIQEDGSTSAAIRRGPVQTELSAKMSSDVSNAPHPQPFGLAPGVSLAKSGASFNLEEKDSISASPVRTELGVVPLPITQPGASEVREPSFSQPIASTPSADPLRFIVERQLDLARDSRWLDALARDIVAVAETPDRLSFRLSPPQLGRLDVDLSASESGLSVRMNASSEAATQIIAAAQPRLIDELKNQGVRVSETQVSTGGGQSQGQGQQQQRDADQMIEYARARFERTTETNPSRPKGRFA